MFYIKFDERTVQAHATIMSQFCHVLWRIQSMWEEGIITDTVTIKVYVPEWIEFCYMSDNHEYTLIEQINFFIKHFEEPQCGINWEVHIYGESHQVTSPWNAQCIWPFNKDMQWVGGGGYITVQKYKNVHTAWNWSSIKAKRSGQIEVIDKIEQYTDLPVKVIDYEMHPSVFFDLLKHTEKHYTYMGGSYYSAALINCPTICYGHPIGDVYPDSLEGKGMPGSAWGAVMGNGFSTICQYDFDRTYNGPQTYVTHAQTPEQLKGFLLELE